MAGKYPKSEYVIKRDNALLQPCRIGDKVVDVPREQPCNVIVVHGVNDVGTSYSAVEERAVCGTAGSPAAQVQAGDLPDAWRGGQEDAAG